MAKKIVPRLRWLDHCDGEPKMDPDHYVLEDGSVTPDDAWSNDEGNNVMFDFTTGQAYTVFCYGSNAPSIVQDTLSDFEAGEL